MLKKLLGLSKEDLEIEISEAEEKFRELKQSEMDSAEKKAEKLKTGIEKSIKQLDKDLGELESFEDSKDRQIINDVVDNVVSDRREMIEDLDLPDDPKEILSEVNQFIADFSDLKDKEAAVLEEAYLDKKLMKYLKPVEKKRGKFSDFIEDKYKVKTDYRKLTEFLEDRDTLIDEKQDLKQEINDNLDFKDLEEGKKQLKQELEDLRNSEDWEEYEKLKKELEDKKSVRTQMISELNSTLNKMERGLKKMIYQAEHGDLDLGNTDVLERLRDNETENILARSEETVETVEETVESVPEDLLNERQHEKFVNAAEELEDLSDRSDEIDELEKEIESLEKEIEDHSVVEKEGEIKSELKQVNKQLKQFKEDRNKLSQKVEQLKLEVKEKEREIRDLLDEALDREVRFKN